MQTLIHLENIRKSILLLLCGFLLSGGELFAKTERDFYRQDFYLNLDGTEQPGNDSEAPPRHWLEYEDTEEEESEVPVQRDSYEEENQTVTPKDAFVIPPEQQKRENIFFFFVLPGIIGWMTISLLWVYFKAWLKKKKEIRLTNQRLWQLRNEFQGKEMDPEFPERLKQVLKLPPGATCRDIIQNLPPNEQTLQQMIDKYEKHFHKPES